MKRLLLCILLTASVSGSIIRGQNSQAEISSALGKLYEKLLISPEDSVRLCINDSIRLIVEAHVISDSIFYQRISNLKYLGQITSSDSLIKIVTWNLILNKEPGRYFCYLIRKSLDNNSNIIYNLTAAYDSTTIGTDTIYSASDWYGALYYDIKPFSDGKGQCWVLLGINYSNPAITRKIIDVLSFTPDERIVLGRKWFRSGETLNYRHVFEYASSGVMSLRFVSDSTIVFDHLVPFSPSHIDDRKYYGPDYSYDAYILKNESWDLEINVDARNKE